MHNNCLNEKTQKFRFKYSPHKWPILMVVQELIAEKVLIGCVKWIKQQEYIDLEY